jgi:hypothetical protein
MTARATDTLKRACPLSRMLEARFSASAITATRVEDVRQDAEILERDAPQAPRCIEIAPKCLWSTAPRQGKRSSQEAPARPPISEAPSYEASRRKTVHDTVAHGGAKHETFRRRQVVALTILRRQLAH